MEDVVIDLFDAARRELEGFAKQVGHALQREVEDRLAVHLQRKVPAVLGKALAECAAADDQVADGLAEERHRARRGGVSRLEIGRAHV